MSEFVEVVNEATVQSAMPTIQVLQAKPVQSISTAPATAGTANQEQQIAKLDNFSTVTEMRSFAAELIKTGLVPKSLKTPEAVVGVVLMGKELGFGAMTALTNIHSIDGRPTLSVHAIGAKLHQKGLITKTIKDFEPVFDQQGNVLDYVTTIRYYQPFHGTVVTEDMTFKWSDAEAAGWSSKPTWTKMPKA